MKKSVLVVVLVFISLAYLVNAECCSDMLVYRGGAVFSTPQYRLYNGTWGTEKTATDIGGTLQYVKVVANPNSSSDEKMLCTFDAVLDVNCQLWNSTNWTGLIEHSATSDTKAFDVEYINKTHAMVCFRNSTDTSIPYCRIWDGSNWIEETALNVGGFIQTIKLFPDPNSNYVTLMTKDWFGDINVQIFDGSSWGNLNETETNVGSCTYCLFLDGAWTSSGDFMAAWFSWPGEVEAKLFSKTTGWGSQLDGVITGIGTGVNHHIKMASNPNASNDELLIAAVSDDDDCIVNFWNGTDWGTNQTLNDSIGSVVSFNHPFYLAYEQTGDYDAIITYGTPMSAIKYRIWDSSTYSLSGENTFPALDENVDWHQLAADPNSEYIMLTTLGIEDDIDTIEWDGDSWESSWTEQETSSDDTYWNAWFTYDYEDEAPTFSNAINTSDTFQIYHNFTANITINSRITLSSYKFSTNMSGSWVNDTAVSISGKQYNASTSKNISQPRETVICWKYYANDKTDTWGESDEYCFTVVNTGPTHTTPILNSTFGTNMTTENLTCYNQSTYDADADADSVKNIYNWYRNGISTTLLNMPFEGGSNATYTKDYSSYDNEPTIDGPTWNSSGGYDGKGAYYFDGSNDYMNWSENSFNFDFNDTFSITLWVNTPGGDDFPLAKGNANSGYRLHLQPDGDVNFDMKTVGASRQIRRVVDTLVNDEAWHHIAVTYDGSRDVSGLTIYVDGDIPTTTGTNNNVNDGDYMNSSQVFYLGRNSGSTAYWYTGMIDEFIIFNRSITAGQVQALYAGRTDVITPLQALKGEMWSCSVTPNDGYQDGTLIRSNNLTILNAPPTINSNASAPAKPLEDETVYIYANVTDPDDDGVIWVNFTITLPNGTVLIDNQNASSNVGDIWNSSTFVVNRIGTWTWNITASDNDSGISTTSGTFEVSSWQLIKGNVTGRLAIRDSSKSTLINWDVVNATGSNIYVTDTDSTISFSDLKALSRDTSGTYQSNDFEELDTLLNRTSFEDSINITYTTNGNPKATSSFTVFKNNVINNVPVANASSSSDFVTGILWDSSDDDDGEFDSTDKEDVVFVTKVNSSLRSQYGYDYALSVVADLKNYKTPDQIKIAIYTELK